MLKPKNLEPCLTPVSPQPTSTSKLPGPSFKTENLNTTPHFWVQVTIISLQNYYNSCLNSVYAFTLSISIEQSEGFFENKFEILSKLSMIFHLIQSNSKFIHTMYTMHSAFLSILSHCSVLLNSMITIPTSSLLLKHTRHALAQSPSVYSSLCLALQPRKSKWFRSSPSSQSVM